MSSKKIVSLGFIFVGVGVITAFGLIAFINSRRPTSGLKVSTSPASVVFINNQEIGLTPIDKTFPPGEATVKIVPTANGQNLAAYQTKIRLTSRAYTVIRRDFGAMDADTAGETITLLSQEDSLPSLTIVTSTPEFASVTLDGQPQGFTPLSVSSVPAGDHQITVSAPGFISRTIPVQTLPSFKLAISAKLAVDKISVTPTSTPLNLPTPSISPEPTTYNPQPTTSITPPYVTILSTPVGFLRVRSGPGTNFTEVGQIKPGQSFPLLGTKADWYHISAELDATSSGYISSQYATKTDN